MSTPVELDGRRQRSRRTRARIVDAAGQLFLRQGYVATTIESVADRAGVAVQTVYYVFGTKPNLLSAVLDAAIVGDAEPVPVVARTWVDDLAKADDAAAAVTHLLESAMAIVARTAPIYGVLRQAAADPEVGALLARTRRARRVDQRRLVEILDTAGHLANNIDVDIAADVVYGLVNEEVFELLVVDCGWDLDRFQRWATTAVQRELIDS